MEKDDGLRADGRIVDNDGPNRREEDHLSWAQVEYRIRVILAEFRVELLSDIYSRNIDPLKDRVDLQDKYCAMHSQQLTQTTTLLNELVEAKLIRRVEVAEARIAMGQKFQAVIGSAALTAIVGLVLMLLTHQIHL